MAKMTKDAVRVQALYARLWERYGDLHWWPADTPYEIMVGAVLTQNTAWENVEHAIAAFQGDVSPERVAALSLEALSVLIRPAGFFRRKAEYLHSLTAWFARYDYSVEKARGVSPELLRRELLALRGIGKETADSILLYALGLPFFVVDAYTKRLLSRLGFAVPAAYDAIAGLFTGALPCDREVYGHMHAMIVVNAKTHCRAKPLCRDCPLSALCRTAADGTP